MMPAPQVTTVIGLSPNQFMAKTICSRAAFILFCRNVMNYRDKPTWHLILKSLAPLLGADGLLWTRHTENRWRSTDLFHSLKQISHRRTYLKNQSHPSYNR